MQSTQRFTDEYWPATGSRVTFVPSQRAVASLPVTAVKLFAIQDHKLLLAKIPKGWDIPGGHVEAGEAPKQALTREIQEETGSNVTNLQLIGYLRIVNEIATEANRHYPKESCIRLYKGDVTELGDRSLLASHEADDRAFIPFDQLKDYYHHWTPMMQQILNYALTC